MGFRKAFVDGNNKNSTGPNEGSKTVVRSMWVGLPHQIKGRWLIDRRSNAMSLWLQNIIISSFAAIESVPAPRVPMRRLFQSVNLKFAGNNRR